MPSSTNAQTFESFVVPQYARELIEQLNLLVPTPMVEVTPGVMLDQTARDVLMMQAGERRMVEMLVRLQQLQDDRHKGSSQ